MRITGNSHFVVERIAPNPIRRFFRGEVGFRAIEDFVVHEGCESGIPVTVTVNKPQLKSGKITRHNVEFQGDRFRAQAAYRERRLRQTISPEAADLR